MATNSPDCRHFFVLTAASHLFYCRQAVERSDQEASDYVQQAQRNWHKSGDRQMGQDELRWSVTSPMGEMRLQTCRPNRRQAH
jgi:hypothetical protein